MNSCPVYKNIGGYTYNTTYSGPIGSVITPHLRGSKDFNHLSFASSLCGRCEEVCPVRIPLPDLLLENRKEAIEKGNMSLFSRYLFSFSRLVLSSRMLMDLVPYKIKSFAIKQISNLSVGYKRQLPKIKEESFSKQWKSKKSL